jgi:hypothetical protein
MLKIIRSGTVLRQDVSGHLMDVAHLNMRHLQLFYGMVR